MTDNNTLPELSDARVDELETALFRAIADERQRTHEAAHEDDELARQRRKRRGRFLIAGTSAAAVIAVAAVIAPSVLTGMSGAGSASDSSAPSGTQYEVASEGSGGAPLGSDGAVSLDGGDTDGTDATRSIITTATASLRVDDPAAAAKLIEALAVDAGGYVEAMSIDGARTYSTDDGEAVYYSGSWITVRIPAGDFTSAVANLSDIGEVVHSEISREDVTTAIVDYRARVEALRASVARLTELLSQSASTADLITVEAELSKRQAELESYQQQLTALEGQVDMSSLRVDLSKKSEPVEANPAGFGDGLAAGWNGFITTVNGIVIALGFLLPWLGVVAIIVLAIWLIVRRRRTQATEATSPTSD